MGLRGAGLHSSRKSLQPASCFVRTNWSVNASITAPLKKQRHREGGDLQSEFTVYTYMTSDPTQQADIWLQLAADEKCADDDELLMSRAVEFSFNESRAGTALNMSPISVFVTSDE
ncbi:hypothetical protein CRENBAI_021200 [Crenichthys baileyi]|uniref:Uncharacterized protein n=1 Tax=Crenichthys baileyi TaxID=28760 RepID=A0AAV9REW9_9TELE